MGEGLTILTKLDPSGFVRGSQKLISAVRSLNNRVAQAGRNTERMASQMASPLKRILPTILGVGSAYGIISKAVSAFMQQNEELSSRMSSIWTALGNVIGPIITQIIDWVTTAVSYFLSFLKLLGVTGKSASQLSQGAKEANNSAKEMKKTLAGFDELNILNDNNNDNGGGGSGKPGLEDIDPSEWMKKLAELLKNKMWDEAADMIVDKINDIIYKVRDKAYEAGQQIGEYLGGIIHIAARIIKDVDWNAVGETIANFVNGLISKIDGHDLGTLLVGKFIIAFGILTGFLENLDWEQTAQFICDAIVGIFESLGDAIEEADFQKIGEGIRKFFEKIDENKEEITQAIFKFFEAVWNAAIDLFKGLLNDPEGENPIVKGLQSTGDALKKFFESLPSDMPNIKENLENLWKIVEKIVGWAGEFALPTALQTLSSVLGALDSVLASVLPSLVSFVDNFLIPFATINVGAVTGTIENLAFALDQLFQTLQGKQSFGDMMDNLWYHGREDMRAFDEALDSIENSRSTILNISSDFASFAEQLDVFGSTSAEAAEDASAFEASLDSLQSELLGYAEGLDNSGTATDFLKTSIGELKEGYQGLAEELMENGNSTSANCEMQERLQEIVAQYVTLLKEEQSTLQESGETIQGISEATQTNADAVTQMADSETQAADAVAKANESLDKVPSTTDAAAEGYSKVGDETKQTSEDTQVTTSEMVEILKADWDELGEHITEKATELKENVVQAMEDMRTELESTFSQLASEASGWGSDMMGNFIEGIRSRMPELEQVVSEAAQTVDSYLGHSHPDKGPLADDYKWMPDMMDLFTNGIRNNQGKLISAVSSVASGVYDAFNIGNGMGGIQLPMSAAASGAFLPYNIGAQDSMFGSSGEDGFISRLSGAIYDAVVTAMSDMQGVTGQRTTILEVNGREFFRATYDDQQAVARERGISLIT